MAKITHLHGKVKQPLPDVQDRKLLLEGAEMAEILLLEFLKELVKEVTH